MILDWTPLSEFIAAHDRFLVTTHVRPDGDALGSELGMLGILKHLGKDVRIVNASLTPPRYDFLDPDGSLLEHLGTKVEPGDLRDREAAVIVDLSSWGQLGEMGPVIRAFPGPRLVIDHHVSQDDLGATYLKDTQAEACGTLIFQAARALNVTISPPMATALLTAIAMDTGWFRHPATNPGTFRAAADLIEAGADVNDTYKLLYERNTLGRLRMMGETLASLRTDLDGKLAYAVVTRDDLERTGAIPPDTEDLVDFTVSLRGVEIGILFYELKQGGIKVSTRSRNGFDCAKLTARYGGGGHKAAAGATLPEPISDVIPRVLADVREAMQQS